jgi:1-phosphofructokinase
LDTSGAALLHTLGAAPDFSKPNREEAAQVLGRNVTNQADALAAAHELMKCGVQSVAVSLGAHGLLWLSGQNAEPVFALPLSVAVNSTVGCGDATVAGFAVAHERGWGPEAALGLALACGAANCLAPLPCQISAAAVERLRSAVLERAG